MNIYKITEASEYLGVSINTLKILTCYSARYYGARGGRKKKYQAENKPVESNGI